MAENRNITTKTTTSRLAGLLKTYYAKKTDLPTKLSQLTNDPGFQTADEVQSRINTAIGAVYKPGGSVAFEALPELTEANLGKVYNITNAFVTTDNFVEGAGKKYKAGADVGIVAVDQDGSTVYKYNVFANFVDLEGYIQKVSDPVAGNLVKQKADGSLEDTGIAAGDVLTEHQDISGKTDKVDGATEGNLAGLDADGNLTDSGVAASDVVTKIDGAVADNLVAQTADGKIVDSGIAKDAVQQKLAADSFANGNIRITDENGFAKDGGIAAGDIVVASDISDYTEDELKALLGIAAE